MKLRNKVLTGIMMTSLTCAAIGGGVSMAAEGVYTETSGGTASTSVTYNAASESTYTVSIPATLKLDKYEWVPETIEVTDCKLATEESTLVISIQNSLDEKGQVRLALKDSNGNVNQNGPFIYSTVMDGMENICSNDTPVLTISSDQPIEPDQPIGSATIQFGPPVSESAGEIAAGEYEGTITFGISVKTPE